MFGSRLLEMSANNIRRVCTTSRFHFSTKVQHTRLQTLNLVISNITSCNVDLVGASQTELTREDSELSALATEASASLLWAQAPVNGPRSVVSALRIGEPTKLNILGQDQKNVGTGPVIIKSARY